MKDTDIIMKQVPPEDEAQLLELTVAVFHGEQQIPQEMVTEVASEDALWWGLYDGPRIIGAVCAWTVEGVYHWGRFCVHPDYRGRGLAKQLAVHSISALFAGGAAWIDSDARDTTVGILSAMGAEVTGPPVVFYGSNVTPMRITRDQFLK